MRVFTPRPLVWHGKRPTALEQSSIAHTSIGDFTIVCTKIKKKKDGTLRYYYTWSFCFEEELCPDEYITVCSFKKAKRQCEERWVYESKLVMEDLLGIDVFNSIWDETN